MKKPLPRATFNEIRPPNDNYVYFQDFASYPFRYETAGYELVNAGWLADFALLVYGNEQFIRTHAASLTAAGFTVKYLSISTTQCLVAHNDKFIVLAIRGTEIDNFWGAVTDWALNLKLTPVPDESGGMVHEGFREAINIAWPGIEEYLQQIQVDGVKRTLWITGHSLGAALATLAAERAVRDSGLEVRGIYTWGSP